MRTLSCLVLALLVFPITSQAFEPTGTIETSPEAKTRQVQRSVNLEALRERLRNRFNRTKPAETVVPLVRKSTVVRRSSRVTGSVNTVGYQPVSLANLALVVSVPEGFSVIRDTLSHDSGEIKLQSGTNSILIKAAGLRCPASGTNLRTCVQRNTKAFADEIMKKDTRLQYLRQRQENQLILNTDTDAGPFGSERNKVVEVLELQSANKRIKVLGFASPEEEYLWYMVLEGNAQRETSIGSDHQALYRIFNSFSQPASNATKPVRREARRSFTSRDRFRNNYRFRANSTDIEPDRVFEEKHIPELGLHLEVTQGARLVQDGSEGGYVFQSGENEISVSVQEEECSGNTSNLLQRCLRERLEVLSQAPEGFRIVTEKNLLMELDKSVGYKNHLGRYVLWQKQGNARAGILLFRHPWQPTVFRVDFASSNSSANQNWAYNDVLLNQFFGSFYFDERD